MADGARLTARDIVDATMPSLRRYGRALSGCQHVGDALAAKARSTTRPSMADISAKTIRIMLFCALHDCWVAISIGSLSQIAARHRMIALTPNSRETLLLRAIEEFSFSDIAEILRLPVSEIGRLFEIALHEIPYSHGTKVLVIEDDPMVAMDMSACLSDMGCDVTGVARTATQAIELAATSPPNLIIASLILADKSSGLNAADEITRNRPDIDVVFVTPYPEQLLTGTQREPVFIIEKPYLDEQVRSAVSQALILSRS